MEPLSLIIGALIAGATAGLTKVADKAVISLYGELVNKLTDHLRKAFGTEKAEQAMAIFKDGEALEYHKDDIKKMLQQANADQDDEIKKLANQLIKATEPESSRTTVNIDAKFTKKPVIIGHTNNVNIGKTKSD